MRLSRRAVLAGLASSQAPPWGSVRAAPQTPPRDVAAALDGRLVRLVDGRLADAPAPQGRRLIAFYFGASWCGPCRAFVPELRGAYPALTSRGVEIVFVSDDGGCEAMRDYVVQSRMPWPVVACDQRRRLAWLQAVRGKALPGLIAFDATGRELMTSWSAGGNSSPRRTLARLLTA